MAKKKTAAAIAALAVLAVGGVAFARSRDEDEDEDDVDDADIVILPDLVEPVGPGGVEPESPPPPPPAGLKNYVGSGYNWPRKDRFPNEIAFAVLLNLFGYNANAALSIISQVNMTAVRQYQRDYNTVLATVPNPPTGKLAEDGLIGKNTIGAMLVSEAWVNTLGKPFPAIVAEAKANA
jgi:hypothetical protein